MIYIKNHAEGDLETVFVLDINTGKSISVNSLQEGFQDMKNAISELDETSDFNQVVDIIEALRVNTLDDKIRNLQEIRKELGITINPDGSVSLPHGVELPEGIAVIFNQVDDLEHGKRLIKFAEKLSNNPREYAREALVAWIIKNPSLTILEDGRIRGYRGLRDDFTSIHAGYGVVFHKRGEGEYERVEYTNDHLDNSVGNIITFPQEMVDHNTAIRCSIGLHVGTWDYASGFGQGKYVAVAFSPEHVVSPPDDAHQSKIRVHEMEILEEVDKYSYDNFHNNL